MSTNADVARAEIETLARLEAEAEQCRARRDRRIRAMLSEDGMTAPAISRELGLSVSLVRLVLRLPDPAA